MVLDSQQYTIIGVLPPNDFPMVRWDVWVGVGPLLDQHMLNRETRYFFVVGTGCHLQPDSGKSPATA